ncbi:MAG: SEC-C domain-containing protein [Vallitaleaceae bacterium]|nr:SEC-C domain-containing protein [Vallitaleaceae bacterium]
MKLFEQWKEIAYKERSQEEYDAFWGEYLPAEQKVYVALLGDYTLSKKGKLSDLAAELDLDVVTFAGFLDGINTSLVKEIELEEITEDSEIDLAIDFEKLYYNMHAATADWLYQLPEWDAILSEERRKEIKKQYNQSKIVVKDKKIGRNDPCPCGSGKKYKQCCLQKELSL